MVMKILEVLTIYLGAYILLLAILKLWEKVKKNAVKQLINAGKKDFENKQYTQQIKKYNWLIRLNPVPSNYSLRANAFSNLKQYENAIKDISKAIDINPYYADFYKSRAFYYSGIENNDLAVKDYNSAIDLKFNLKDYYYLFLFRAQSLEDNKEYQLAINDYDIAIKNIPEAIEAYTGKGFCLFELKEYDGALSCYQKAIELDDKNYLAFYSRGELFYQLKKVDEALQDLNKALELRPTTENSYLFLWLGVLYAVNGKENEKAMSFLQKAKELNNEDAQECIDELNNTGKIIMEW